MSLLSGFKHSKPLARFSLGRVFLTPGAIEALRRANRDSGELLARHQAGDWGEIPEIDKRQNDETLSTGGRILSAYCVGYQVLWVTTTADRKITHILLPSEY